MMFPKALIEAINETTESLEQQATGLFAIEKLTLVALWQDGDDEWRVTMELDHSKGIYSGDWQLNVEPVEKQDLEATGPKTPLILQNPPRKALAKKAVPPRKSVRGYS